MSGGREWGIKRWDEKDATGRMITLKIFWLHSVISTDDNKKDLIIIIHSKR